MSAMWRCGPVAADEKVQIVVSQVHIADQGLEVSFMQVPTGVRDIAGQPVALINIVQIDLTHPSYGDAVKQLIKDVEALVADVMDDYDGALPFVPYEGDDLDHDDEGPSGMGYP